MTFDQGTSRLQTMAPEVAPQLPYLSRYARLCTGSDCRAHNLLATVLEIAGMQRGGLRSWSLTSLMRLLIQLDRGSDRAMPSRARFNGGSRASLPRKVAGLAWQERHALLLVVVEELDYQEAADLLDMDVEELRRHLASARRRIAFDSGGPPMERRRPVKKSAGRFDHRLRTVP